MIPMPVQDRADCALQKQPLLLPILTGDKLRFRRGPPQICGHSKPR